MKKVWALITALALMALLTSSSVVWLTLPRWATVTAFCAALMRSSTMDFTSP